ncbi:EF hand [compost metagenome]
MMNRKLKSTGKATATVAAFALMLGGFAMETNAGEAEHPEDEQKPAFEQLDTDRDGQITQSEAQETWLAAVFQNVDQDRNGKVNRSEYDLAMG